MITIGLTGGVGMGKSTAATFLARHGLAIIDTDALAREVVAPGQPALREVREVFGSEMIDQHGHLNRENLAKLVFADEARRKKLEAILHPRIRERWLAGIEHWKKEGRSGGVVVIPLLFETQTQQHFDTIICVACSAPTQRERLDARNWSPSQIEQRIAAQWPIDRKMAQSEFVVWTEGTIDVHGAQIDRVLQTLGVSRGL